MVTFNYTEEFLRQAKRYRSLADDIDALQHELGIKKKSVFFLSIPEVRQNLNHKQESPRIPASVLLFRVVHLKFGDFRFLKSVHDRFHSFDIFDNFEFKKNISRPFVFLDVQKVCC